MSELKPIRIGDRVTKFPALTQNALIAGEQKRRNSLALIEDLRKPKQKSSIYCRIAWEGPADIEPGDIVKIGDVIHEPATDAWAPYEGLSFHADEFGSGDSDKPFAIALEPLVAVDVGGGDSPNVGAAIIPQAYWAKVNVSDAGHTHAKIPATGTVFDTGTSGQLIIWKETGTGEKWAVVQIGGGGGAMSVTFGVVTTEVGPATGTIDEITPGEGEVQLYATDGAGVRTPVGSPIAALNYDPGETYLVRTGVYLGSVAGGPAEVISAFCALFDEGA